MNVSVGVGWNNRQGVESVQVKGSTKQQLEVTNQRGSSFGYGMSFNLLNNSYVPPVEMPLDQGSMHVSVKLGTSVFGADITGNVGGFFSLQKLRYNSVSVPAFGYAHAEDARFNESAMEDFNLEKNRPFTHNQTNLCFPNFTYDQYSVSGFGIGGSFRPFRSEAGFVHDRLQNSYSLGGSLGFEIGGGNMVHGGLDATVSFSDTHTGNWADDNNAQPNMPLKTDKVSDLVSPCFFKMSGEMGEDPDYKPGDPTSLFNKTGGYAPVQTELAKSFGYSAKTTSNWKPKYSTPYGMSSNQFRTARPPRNQPVSYRKFSEMGTLVPAPPLNTGHHIGEYAITKTDGSRYVYGNALFNTRQRDVTFNASGLNIQCDKGSVIYTPGQDNSINNKNGGDHYFNAQELPPFVHTWLLTSVLSPDYVDDNTPGPSTGDLGTWVHFGYSAPINCKWRIPYEQNQATFNEGLKTDSGDDKGSYVYGEKQVSYLNMIETKTQVAVFFTSTREDAYEVINEDGGRAAKPTLQKLDSIHLFARPDWDLNGKQGTPIKSVRFVYNYSLCGGIPSSGIGQGKLTLAKVYFTYGRSFRGALSAYSFEYGSGSLNPSYDPMAFNVWGDYKPQNGGCAPGAALATFEFPFVGTNKSDEDKYAAAWMLKAINLPEGGRIEVDLEADDYAYVQDKPAMQMLKVDKVGTGPNASDFTGNQLYDLSNKPSLYLSIELPSPCGSSPEFINKYVKNIASGESMYFRFMTDLTDNGKYEYVEGYANINSAGLIDPNHGYLELKPAFRGDKKSILQDLEPITKAAFGFGRAYRPKMMSGIVDPIAEIPGLPGDSQAEQMLGDMLQPALINGLFDLFMGPNGVLLSKKFGRTFIPAKSWVRLYCPGNRYGGGHRVHKITLNDKWDAMAGPGNANTAYVQSYSYTLKDSNVSSGVASYMPIGCKENPWIQPVFFSTEHILAPDELHYQERPFGESYFPSPGIGYRRVSVKTEVPPTAKRGSGQSVHEYYTTYDFPTRVDETSLDAIPQKTGLLGKLFSINVKDRMTCSQGYVVEINNMNGLEKSEQVYGEGQNNFISGIDYIYETETRTVNFNPFSNATVSVTNLKNEVPVISRDGSIAKKHLGVDFDVSTWFTESETESETIGFQPNIATFLLSVLPGAVPTIWPTVATQNNRYRAAVTAKVIHRQGILKKVIAHDLGASVTTENLAWDETGDVLLTRTENEFGDPEYEFKFPAHWIYDGMGPANKNIMLREGLAIGANGQLTTGTTNLAPGDEVISEESTPRKFWVLLGTGANLHLVDKAGQIAPAMAKTTFQIARSGRRNLQHMPVSTITTTYNPMDRFNTGLASYISFGPLSPTETGVLQSHATTYSENWQTKCRFPDCGEGNISNQVNPYIVGIRGNWQRKKTYAFLTPRKQTDYTAANDPDQHLNIREDGQFSNFATFPLASTVKGGGYSEPSSPSAGWQLATEVTKWLPTAEEVENRDALGRYSAVQFGYNDAFAVAVAANSRYSQMGFDGFEDYQMPYDPCKPSHFGFEQFAVNRTNQVSHSGRYSMSVPTTGGLYMDRLLTTSPCIATFNEVPYKLKSCDCAGRFGPETYAGNPLRYVLSFWKRSDNPNPGTPIFNYTAINYVLTVAGSTPNIVETQNSKIIDGWQKVDVVFDLPLNATGTIHLGFTNTGPAGWVDDVRIHPFNGSLKSYVYDPLTLRLWAELDERNFATFYQYDKEGILIRVKKETDRGVMTIEEHNSSTRKQ